MEAKPKQIPSDPKQTPLEENPSVAPASLVESGALTNNLLPESCRVEPLDPQTVGLVGPQRTMRRPPDFPELARSGDLPASIKPYELGRRKKDGSLYLKYCGAGGDGSTATTTNCVRLGYEKAIGMARAFRAQFPDADASEIRDEVGHLEGVDEEWIEKNVLHSARSSKELSAELSDMAIANIPEVKRWGVVPPAPAGTIEPGKASVPQAGDGDADVARGKGTKQPAPKGMPQRSPWLRVVYQAIAQCGSKAGYQEIASWIGEKFEHADLPNYCAGKSDRELFLLVKHHSDVRMRFQKDLSKMKRRYLNTQK
jgi:hypothetical protein